MDIVASSREIGVPHRPHTTIHVSSYCYYRTSDFLSREGEGREVVGERLRDKTAP
jgi:hypothetical protein